MNRGESTSERMKELALAQMKLDANHPAESMKLAVESFNLQKHREQFMKDMERQSMKDVGESPIGSFARPILRVPNPAESARERIQKYIIEFENGLDSDHEIGISLVSFGATIFHIERIGFFGVDLISFYGVTDSGDRVQLIQNIAQINILLIAAKKQNENPRRLGFSME